MTSQEILRADVLDILFEKRNKLYGAYTLRKNYVSRLYLALGIALGSVGLFVFLGGIGDTGKDGRSNAPLFIRPMTAEDLHLPVVRSPVPPPAPRLPMAQRSFHNRIKYVDNPDPSKNLESMDDIRNATLSDRNLGDFFTPDETSVAPTIIKNETPSKPREPEKVFVPVESGPEFPGGREAWTVFLNRHLQTPDYLEPGEKKLVLIRFFVDTDGAVNGFKVLQSGGAVFDDEVIRVLRKMPRWKPAIQNGHPVAVSFTQPVTFVGVEQ